jgi:hypothetical protein
MTTTMTVAVAIPVAYGTQTITLSDGDRIINMGVIAFRSGRTNSAIGYTATGGWTDWYIRKFAKTNGFLVSRKRSDPHVYTIIIAK